jgi:hypothetical protein
MFDETTVEPFGPHHCCMCSGSVKHCHNSSRGASKTREMTKSLLLAFSLIVPHPLGPAQALPARQLRSQAGHFEVASAAKSKPSGSRIETDNSTLVVENATHTAATPGAVLLRSADGRVGR